MILLFIFILGLVFGSFLTAFTHRVQKGESVAEGHSKCPNCKVTISWYDNIPLFSYLALGGKCRSCGKKISKRYPVIELTTGMLFVMLYLVSSNCIIFLQDLSLQSSPICFWHVQMSWLVLPYFLSVAVALFAIFITDWESQTIPDEPVFWLFSIGFLVLVFFSPENLYYSLFLAFATSLFFLFLHLITLGRGMGLGDVKLVISLALILGNLQLTILWLFMSFVLGAGVGIIMIIMRKASFGKHIAFGPFLVISFILTLFFGGTLSELLFPFF